MVTNMATCMDTVSAVNGGTDDDVISDITVDVTGNGPWTIDFTLDGIAQSASGVTLILTLKYSWNVITMYRCKLYRYCVGNTNHYVNPIPTITVMEQMVIYL